VSATYSCTCLLLMHRVTLAGASPSSLLVLFSVQNLPSVSKPENQQVRKQVCQFSRLQKAFSTEKTNKSGSRFVNSLGCRRLSALRKPTSQEEGLAPARVEQRPSLKSKLHRELQLPRIAHALSQEPVKVEQSRCNERIDVVRVVEGIEHLENRNYRSVRGA